MTWLQHQQNVVPSIPVRRFEVEAWARMGAIQAFDRGDRLYVPVRARTTPHDRLCDCMTCTDGFRRTP